MYLTVLPSETPHTPAMTVKVSEVEYGLAVDRLQMYLKHSDRASKNLVRDALYELDHERTISTESQGIIRRVDNSLLTSTHYKARR